jgi:hypothetical protein
VDKLYLTFIAFIAVSALCLPGCFDFFDDSNSQDVDDDYDDDNDDDDADIGTDDMDWPADWIALEDRVLVLVNERRRAGATCGQYGTYEPTHDLTAESHLRRAARLHSQDMAERNYFSHDSPEGPNGDTMDERIENAGYLGWTYIGENIAAGQTTAEQVVETWMNSDGHCINIMSPYFEELGIGYFYLGAADS